MTELARLEKKLLQRMKRTCEDFRLLAPGDRILVGVSGGKDSYTLLRLLDLLVPRLPFEVSVIAVHLDQAQPGYDGEPLRRYLEARGKEYEILREDTYSVVVDHVEEGGTYCSLCSRLRRGILYTAAERLGCNKIALGHHRDDTLETFLLNLFYSGKLQAMPARYVTDDGRFEVIRPLVECAEDQIAEYARAMEFPILPCNLCGSQDGLKRDRMTTLLSDLEKEIPNVRQIMLAALSNVRPSHLLDREVAEVWANRPAEVRPIVPKVTPKHAEAKPVAKRLPIVGERG
ncbi:MAG: tRNA 2-thiocytidine(32) synthetase TtcA [Myxococcales bacterium]|nr:tRNA 2-thiocytidine(32) synthetase TtcA [Myxococcales bacterium]